MSKIRPVETAEIVRPPEAHPRLTSIAEDALREVDTYGEVPTPLDRLMELQGLELIEDERSVVEEFFSSLSSLSEKDRRNGRRALNKLRGVLDRRERKVWVRSDPWKPRQSKFPQAHEIGHDLVGWHGVNPEYLDDDETLSPEVREQFEREANFIAGELLFQGERFRDRALSTRESLRSALGLAEEHETTYWSTLRRFTEVQDRPVGLAVYGRGRGMRFNFLRLNASERFREKYAEVEIPSYLSGPHPWKEATIHGKDIVKGNCNLMVGTSETSFSWESWSNHHNLFVLIRRGAELVGLKAVM